MAHVSSNSFSMKDSSPFYPGTKTPSRFNLPMKPKFNASTLSLLKDKLTQKPFTEVLIPEKKPIHGRSISKTRTLPHLRHKISETQIDSSTNNSAINPQEKVNSRFGNPNFCRVKGEMKEKIKIQVSKFQDSKINTKTSGEFYNSEENNTPTILINSATSGKSIRINNLSVQAFSPVASERKNVNQDPFYYANILNHSDFNSFQSLLEGTVDLSFNDFPYYKRIFVKNGKIEPFIKVRLQKSPKAKFECLCKRHENENNKLVHMVRIRDLGRIVPQVELVYFEQQPSWFSKNLIIFSSTILFGNLFTNINQKLQTLSCMRKLSKSFQIVLVCETSSEDFKELLFRFKELKIRLSALYKVCYPNTLKKELGKMLDYSKVYQDFCIVSPEKQVLIVASHRIADAPNCFREFVAKKTGLSFKLNVERVSVPSEEYPNIPLTVLLPNYLLDESVGALNRVVRQVEAVRRMGVINELLHFKVLVKDWHSNKLVTSVIHEALHEEAKVRFKDRRKQVNKSVGHCKLHKKPVYESEKFLESMYLI